MKRFLLPAIFLLGFFLRVLWLDQYPSGFTPDEASFGYDAYSILKTGKDQWGKPFPLVLESFGDFKSPLYAYLTIPSVAIFGLTKVAVRLPNAILGSLAVLVTYFLTRELFRKKNLAFSIEHLALSASFLLAISPWHIQLSRGAFEANLTTFLLPLGIFFFLKGLHTASYPSTPLRASLLLAAFLFGLDLFSYHAAKIVTPLVLVSLILLYKDRIEFKSKEFFFGTIVFLALLAGAFYVNFLGAGTRASERSITSGALEAAFAERTRSSGFLHNKYLVVVDRFTSNYLTYFSPQFLFTEGPPEGTYGMIPGRGVFYLFTIPFILFYVLRAARYGLGNVDKLVLLWIVLAPVPAALATGVGYHANRVATMIVPLTFMLALGAYEFFSWLESKRVLLITFYLILITSFVLFLEDYFIQSPYKISKAMLYGNLEVAEWVSKNVESDRKVIVDKSLSEPHIYFAFAEGIAPSLYREATKEWNYETWVDQMPEYSLGRYTFTDIKPADAQSDAVLVGKPEDFEKDASPIFMVNYPDGKPAVFVVDLRDEKYAKAS